MMRSIIVVAFTLLRQSNLFLGLMRGVSTHDYIIFIFTQDRITVKKPEVGKYLTPAVVRFNSSTMSCMGIFEEIRISKIRSNPSLSHRNPDLVHSMKTDWQVSLSDSIQQVGLLHPIVVRPKEQYFELVAGSRRLSACKSLGWQKILCHVVDLSDKEAYEISLIENVQRKTIEPLEEAHAFKKYIIEHGWGGVTELAHRIGKSPSYVEKRLKLLQLPRDVIQSISSRDISPAVAFELAMLKSDEEKSRLGMLIKERRLSSRRVHQLVNVRNEIIPTEGSMLKYDIPEINSVVDLDRKTHRLFDKAILIFKVARLRITELIHMTENDWVIYESMMQHKRMLDDQIDLLIKEKKKM